MEYPLQSIFIWIIPAHVIWHFAVFIVCHVNWKPELVLIKPRLQWFWQDYRMPNIFHIVLYEDDHNIFMNLITFSQVESGSDEHVLPITNFPSIFFCMCLAFAYTMAYPKIQSKWDKGDNCFFSSHLIKFVSEKRPLFLSITFFNENQIISWCVFKQ